MKLEKLDFSIENSDELFLGEKIYDSRNYSVDSSHVVYDRYRHGVDERTYTCFSSDVSAEKLLAKTKLILHKSGPPVLLRFLYPEQTSQPVIISEYGQTSDLDISYPVFQISLGNCNCLRNLS